MRQYTKHSNQIVAIVPAAGSGSRMCSAKPKQYLTIGSLTLLEHSVYALLKNPAISHVIVVIPAGDQIFSQLSLARDSRISSVIGGEQRANSVLAGLQHEIAEQAKWALVHDAARPCLHPADLQKLLQITEHSKVGAILAAPVRDTIKQSRQEGRQIALTVDRTLLWHALTPQIFIRELLVKCLTRMLNEDKIATDEASALEYCGYQPLLVPGRFDNIKVTCPEDLALAQFYLLGPSGT